MSGSSATTTTSSGPGVVERASKEISKRIHSLGFSRASSPKRNAKTTEETKNNFSEDQQKVADKLNGNELSEDGNKRSSSSSSNVSSATSNAASSVTKMGNIIKGSVMDKVTHVFNSSSMGNSNNKEQQPQAPVAAPASAPASSALGSSSSSTSPGINIPKGAVANGRAKFEVVSGSAPAASQQPVSTDNNSSTSSSKPLRFFSSSKSRGNSPLLPVKTPKVPPPSPNLSQNISSASTANVSNGSNKQSTPLMGKKKSNNNSNNNNNNGNVVGTAGNNNLNSSPANQSKAQPELSPNSKLFPKMKKFVLWEEMWKDSKFLTQFFRYFTSQERCVLAQVCKVWKEQLYQPVYWLDQRPVLQCRILRSWEDNDPVSKETKVNFFKSIESRGFESLVLQNANDADVFDFVQNCPQAAKTLHGLVLRCCNLSDRGLEALMEFLQSLYQLEIAGCNEITEQGLWSSLHPRLVSVTINDCINVADECICAVTQLLPSLYEFNLQAYHVTDSALSYFSPKQTGTLNVLRLQSCWEITNHGVVNIVHTLPNLTVLSLSGCSKVTDDGVELIAENLRKLRSLDVSWCPRVTDAALEYIACDLNHLEELTLDRCVHITDIGIGYISTMLALNTLYLRWCTQIRDFGLQHICGMRSMQVLSLAGCPLLTATGMSNLIQLRHLVELELTNCPGATTELILYLRQNLPNALVLD